MYIEGYKYDGLSLKHSITTVDNIPVTHSLFNGKLLLATSINVEHNVVLCLSFTQELGHISFILLTIQHI